MTIPPRAAGTATDPSADADRARRARRAGLVTIVLILVVATALLPRTLRKMPDFEVYWRAGQRAIAAEPINQPQDGHFQHKYLPAFAFVAIPLARLPLRQAKAVWLYVVVSAIVGLVWVSVYSLPGRRRMPSALVAITLVAMLKFFAREVTLGQTNALMALAVVSAAACDRAGRWVIGGALFALAVVFKPYAIVFLAYLAWTRRFAAVGVAGACLAGAVVLPSVNYGLAGNVTLLDQWIRTLRDSTPALLVNQDNISVWALYAKWLGPSQAASLLSLLTCAGLLAFAMYATSRRNGGDEGRYVDVALVLLLLPLWSPQGWDYVLLGAAPAVVAFANWSDEIPAWLRWLTVTALGITAFSIYDVLGRRLYLAFMATSAITVCACVLVAATIYLRIRLTRANLRAGRAIA